MKPVLVIAASAGLMLAGLSGSDAAPPERDPFIIPFEAAHAAALSEGAALSDTLELRGVLWAGDESLANVSGEILAIGESLEGYVLVEVSEDGAVFERAGTRYSVMLATPENESEENDS